MAPGQDGIAGALQDHQGQGIGFPCPGLALPFPVGFNPGLRHALDGKGIIKKILAIPWSMATRTGPGLELLDEPAGQAPPKAGQSVQPGAHQGSNKYYLLQRKGPARQG